MIDPPGGDVEERPFERVYTVWDYWDGPRIGIADLDGVPHVYHSVFREDPDDWDPDDRFELSPVSAETLSIVLEDGEIWKRWGEADIDHADRSTDFALPADRARRDEIQPLVRRAMEIDPAHRRAASGDFRLLSGRPGRGRNPTCEVWEVRWTPAE